VRDQVRDKVEFGFEDLGEQQLKNIARPVRVYRIPLAETARTNAPLPLPDKPSLAVLPFQNMTGDAQFEFYVKGPRRRRKAGGARIGRPLRPRRQRA
jgi:adenylate cyclase